MLRAGFSLGSGPNQKASNTNLRAIKKTGDYPDYPIQSNGRPLNSFASFFGPHEKIETFTPWWWENRGDEGLQTPNSRAKTCHVVLPLEVGCKAQGTKYSMLFLKKTL